MRLYEQRNDKRQIQCNYCYKIGHNKRHCPTMKAHWDANPQVHETYDHDSLIGIDKSMFAQRYQQWYGDEQAKHEFRAHWQYMKDRFAPKSETKKPRKATKCGFCGEEGHTRRNCETMKNFIHVLEQTNREYRSQFYDRFIEGMGLGAGALVQLQSPNIGETHVALVTDLDPSKIIFTNLKTRWSDYHSKHHVGFMIGSDKIRRELSNLFYDEDYYESQHDLGVWNELYSNWGVFRSVISPAPNRPSKEWFLGQAPCFDWIVKKRDHGTLVGSLSHLINAFYPHDDLKERIGEEMYRAYFRQYAR